MRKLRFNWRNIERAPADIGGVYIIWSKYVCVYVGKTDKQSLRNRLRQHYNGSHNSALNLWLRSSHLLWFSYEARRHASAVAALERNRIKQYAPLTNIRLRKKEEQYGINNTGL